jgi:hypothetical protein
MLSSLRDPADGFWAALVLLAALLFLVFVLLNNPF